MKKNTPERKYIARQIAIALKHKGAFDRGCVIGSIGYAIMKDDCTYAQGTRMMDNVLKFCR